MTATETLVAGLFDYAGLYPPASLGLRSAVGNFVEYTRGKHALFLGRFIVNADRLGEFRTIVGDSLGLFRMSVIVTEVAGFDAVGEELRRGLKIETIEIKCTEADDIERISREVPPQLPVYFEVPVNASGRAALSWISRAGARAKIRMGGVVPEAIPAVSEAVEMLSALAELRLPFKATAGLHHPIRSRRALTYQEESPRGTMHGFANLCFAAAAVYYGGKAGNAEQLLKEEDADAWQIGRDAIGWRDLKWSKGELATMRREFFQSIGSCSFEEPMQDLESLGWL